MAKSKGIDAHKVFKLGKAAAKKDERNLKLATLLKAGPALPSSYDFDTTHAGIPTPMFADDDNGDCVIAGRAHQTLRFEDIEQGSVLMILDKDVLKEYHKETGGPDTGLVVLDSLKLWRKKGWKVGIAPLDDPESEPKRRSHRPWLNSTALGPCHLHSSAVKRRPYCGCTPSTWKKFSETGTPLSRSGSPLPLSRLSPTP